MITWSNREVQTMPLDSSSEIAIWQRVIHPKRGDMPVDVARFFLNLSFDKVTPSGCTS